MKNRLPFLTLIAVMIASLAACDSTLNLFGGHSGSTRTRTSSSSSENASESSSDDISSSSDKSSSDPSVPLPEPGDLTANHASYTYTDYTENNLYTLSCTPSVKEAKILVIPIWFDDSSSYIASSKKESVRQDIEDAYFGTNEETGWRSVKTYYEEESHGTLTLTGTVSNWYTDKRSSTSFGSPSTGQSNTEALVKTVTDWYFNNNPSEKRYDYDQDGDGYLDGVMLIYAAPDYGSSNQSESKAGNLWAYCYWLQNGDYQSPANPGPNAYFWASFDFMYGREVYASKTGVSSKQYPGGDTAHSSLDTHTFIHEMGHMFGLEDYYDYSGNYSPAAGFSMQDHNVGGHDPFSSFALGWGKAYIPTATTNINLKPFATTGEMIVLTPSWNSDNSPFDEYIIVEYYTSEGVNYLDSNYEYHKGRGYPTGSKTPGIRVWHVDARLLYTETGAFLASNWTTNPSTKEGNVVMMMSNTYNGRGAEGYITPLGSDYANFNLLQMIRRSTTATHKNNNPMTSDDLFKVGDIFSMSTYSKQFVYSGKLNTKKDLGFNFEINGLTSEYASITVNKL